MDQKENGLNSRYNDYPDTQWKKALRNRDREYRRIKVPVRNYMGFQVMLKNNINTAGMATSAGRSLCHLSEKDAGSCKESEENGAVILGKRNNLSEFANYLSGLCPPVQRTQRAG